MRYVCLDLLDCTATAVTCRLIHIFKRELFREYWLSWIPRDIAFCVLYEAGACRGRFPIPFDFCACSAAPSQAHSPVACRRLQPCRVHQSRACAPLSSFCPVLPVDWRSPDLFWFRPTPRLTTAAFVRNSNLANGLCSRRRCRLSGSRVEYNQG